MESDSPQQIGLMSVDNMAYPNLGIPTAKEEPIQNTQPLPQSNDPRPPRSFH